MNDISNNVLIRRAVEKDLNFIRSTWLRSYRNNSAFAMRITNETYYKYHSLLIQRIFDRGATILVACDIKEPNVVFGYLVTESDVAHFAYVKKPFRKLGIMTKLYNESALTEQFSFTHFMPFCDKLFEIGFPVTYNPYLV